MKGQSFIVEFILFFIISFSLFATISYYFFSQNEYYQNRIAEKTSSLVNNLVATDIIKGINCKGCDEVLISEEIPSKIGGYFYKIQLDNKGLNTTLFIETKYFEQNQLFNLNKIYSVSGTNEVTSENKIVKIKINNVNKRLGIE